MAVWSNLIEDEDAPVAPSAPVTPTGRTGVTKSSAGNRPQPPTGGLVTQAMLRQYRDNAARVAEIKRENEDLRRRILAGTDLEPGGLVYYVSMMCSRRLTHAGLTKAVGKLEAERILERIVPTESTRLYVHPKNAWA